MSPSGLLSRGGLRLAARTAGSFLRMGADAAGLHFGASLPRTKQEIARPEVIDALIRHGTPEGQRPLPPVRSVSLPGVDFESSNCINFLIEVEFEPESAARPTDEHDAPRDLPKTLYVKLPCESLTTRAFARTLGFWSLECRFCQHVAAQMPIRVPRVYAAVQQGSRFVLLLENLFEIPGARLFLNRDMAAGTTLARAERVLRSFAAMHAHFWDWPTAARESLLPASYNTYLAPRTREMTRALNASALEPARRAAPDLISPRLADTYRFAIDRWDRLLAFWYSGPLTLVHGDSHLGNCFEYPGEDGPRIGLIDFQATHWSKGVRDVQYFLINSLDSDLLEANETSLLAGYCEALREHGVTLSTTEALQQYRAFSFQTLVVGVVPLGLGNLTERDETVRAITQRSTRAIERLGFREWLEAL